jgi:hypothetical protein
MYRGFATRIALGLVKQSLRKERNTDSQTFYKNYISSVNYTCVINYPVN